MLTTVLFISLVLITLLILGKVAYAMLGPRPYLRNDDDPFKIGSTAWSRYGPGSEGWKERYNERER
jgi:hypothetical protein